jgi:hypothetical protein
MPEQSYPDFEYDPPEERSVTAFLAAALAVVGGLWHLGGVVGNAMNLAEGRVTVLNLLIGLTLNLVLAAMLIGGAVLLLRRRSTGRTLVLVGTSAVLLSYALTATLSILDLAYVGFVGVGLVGGVLALLIVGVPAAATLVLAIAPSTAHWVEEPESAPRYPTHGW